MFSQKCLYITLQPVVLGDGASDKAFAQRDAISNIGINCHIAFLKSCESGLILFLDDQKIANIIHYGDIYEHLLNIVFSLDVSYLYIRYGGMATYKFNRFLKFAKLKGIKIYLEIPTYPYDGEAVFSSPIQAYRIYREKFFRCFMHKYIFRIVTSSLYKEIFGIPTIQLSNAPARALPLTKSIKEDSCLRMIAVANFAFWHGYDRLIRGLADYYKGRPHIKVYLTLIGKGNELIFNELQDLVRKNDISEYVLFAGQKVNKELDDYFDKADLAIGCLGCHRKRIFEVKSLKNVEYAMRGLPFVYSESNSDFDDKRYVLRVPADESDINIQQLIDFLNNLEMTKEEISLSVKDFTWDHQMRKVFFNETNYKTEIYL